MVNPCPCMSLQRGAMALAILDAVLSMMNLGLMILALIAYLRYDNDDRDKDDDEYLSDGERRASVIVIIVFCVICIMQVLLAFRLYIGARNRDYRNCRIWLIVTTVVTTLNIITLILNLTVIEWSGFAFGGTVVVVLYKLYEMSVVYGFLQELKREVLGLGIGFTPVAYPQHQPPPPYEAPYYTTPHQQAPPIYTTPQSQEAYPMQQYAAYPTSIANQHYMPPTHHHHVTVTTTNSRIS